MNEPKLVPAGKPVTYAEGISGRTGAEACGNIEPDWIGSVDERGINHPQGPVV
jgi:hypothetical protein